MIAINGDKLNIVTPKTPLEKKIKAAWELLDSKYDFTKGKTLVLKLKDEYKRNVVLVDSNFKEATKTKAYPNSIGLGYDSMGYINGEASNVICYDRRSKDKDGNYIYFPDAKRITKDITLTINDKDFIIFLYMFSGFVEDSPKDFNFTLAKKVTPKFYFEDLKKEVKSRMGKLQRASKIYNIVVDLDEKDLRRLSASLNLPGFDVDITESLQEQLVELARSEAKWYDLIIAFSESHDRIIYEVEEKVAEAVKRKVFGFTKKMNHNKQAHMEWVYKKNGVQLKDVDPVLSHPGDKTEQKIIVDHFVINQDAYNAFLIRTSID